jgi:hypothetical protein
MKHAWIISALVFSSIALTGGGPLEADIYTWTDKDGVKHFSNRPPADAPNPEVAFKEYQYDPATDQQRFEVDQQEWNKLIEQIQTDERKAAEEAQRRDETARQNRQPTLEERAAAEKERLKKLIAELEEKPLAYYGSQKNKRVRLGYYRYRLETLSRDPEAYFSRPEEFEGNIQQPK